MAVRLQPDTTVVAVTFLFCLLATLGFSLGPAVKAARTDVVTDLKAQAGDAGVHGKWNRFFAARHLLVMTKSLNFIDAAGAALWERERLRRLAMGGDPILQEIDQRLGDRREARVLKAILLGFGARQRALAVILQLRSGHDAP